MLRLKLASPQVGLESAEVRHIPPLARWKYITYGLIKHKVPFSFVEDPVIQAVFRDMAGTAPSFDNMCNIAFEIENDLLDNVRFKTVIFAGRPPHLRAQLPSEDILTNPPSFLSKFAIESRLRFTLVLIPGPSLTQARHTSESSRPWSQTLAF